MRKSTLKKMRAARDAYLVQQKQGAQDWDIFLTALHEAGHALSFTLLLNGVEYAAVDAKMIVCDGRQIFSGGITQPNEHEITRETIERIAICHMAGPAAEDMRSEEKSGYVEDLKTLCQYAEQAGLSQDEIAPLPLRGYYAARELIESHLSALKQIAMELASKGRIEGDAVTAIIEKGS
jgi:ATP-dependent Zn protease